MQNAPYRRALVVGANGGIGGALLDALAARGLAHSLEAWSRREPARLPAGARWTPVNFADEATLAAAAQGLDGLDCVIVATGLLHNDALKPEKSYRAVEASATLASYFANAVIPMLVAKHVMGKFPAKERAVFSALSARVGSIGDNRLGGWHSYRAAKAALNQLIKTVSIELKRAKPLALCVGLHPGSVQTALSAPFHGGVAPENLFTPERAAGHLLDVLGRLTPEDSGGVFDWAGARVPD